MISRSWTFEQVPATAPHASVLRFDLDSVDLHDAVAILTNEERARAERYRDPLIGRRSAISRAALRTIIASRMNCGPESVVIQTDPLGRPFVPGCCDFNLSHTADVLLVATAENGWRVGVDIESLERDVSIAQIARRLFSENEATQLAQLEPPKQMPFLLARWTRKEAYVKMTGEGIRVDLTTLDIDTIGRVWRERVQTMAEVVPLDVGAGYIAALCVAPSRSGDASQTA